MKQISLRIVANMLALLTVARHMSESRSVDEMIRRSGEVVRTVAQGWCQVSKSL